MPVVHSLGVRALPYVGAAADAGRHARPPRDLVPRPPRRRRRAVCRGGRRGTQVCADAALALAAWSGADLVLVGADAAGEVVALAPPRRPGVHVVGHGVADPVFRAAVELGAESVLDLPDGGGVAGRRPGATWGSGRRPAAPSGWSAGPAGRARPPWPARSRSGTPRGHRRCSWTPTRSGRGSTGCSGWRTCPGCGGRAWPRPPAGSGRGPCGRASRAATTSACSRGRACADGSTCRPRAGSCPQPCGGTTSSWSTSPGRRPVGLAELVDRCDDLLVVTPATVPGLAATARLVAELGRDGRAGLVLRPGGAGRRRRRAGHRAARSWPPSGTSAGSRRRSTGVSGRWPARGPLARAARDLLAEAA